MSAGVVGLFAFHHLADTTSKVVIIAIVIVAIAIIAIRVIMMIVMIVMIAITIVLIGIRMKITNFQTQKPKHKPYMRKCSNTVHVASLLQFNFLGLPLCSRLLVEVVDM